MWIAVGWISFAISLASSAGRVSAQASIAAIILPSAMRTLKAPTHRRSRSGGALEGQLRRRTRDRRPLPDVEWAPRSRMRASPRGRPRWVMSDARPEAAQPTRLDPRRHAPALLL